MNRLTDVRSRADSPLMIAPAEPVGRTGPAAVTPSAFAQATAQPPAEPGLRTELQERTADLQRLKAEYDNYRKRVRRDRLAVREIAVANVLRRLLPVLDSLAEAEPGEAGGFQRVAQSLRTELAGLGLHPVGSVGDPFDPVVHEAVSYDVSDRFERPTCTVIVRPGYRVGGHLLRPAQVIVGERPTDEGGIH
ncbi:nucleotide exchange factor GrpE [Streptomyces sp. NBC_00390]|uniref:nucleotide exchange factor GrpE n=1 Tax=Streptomyces sp. NBC_00390 TaxID=2975736 RepID=UPI002E21C1FE